jgi:hypothetical protein
VIGSWSWQVAERDPETYGGGAEGKAEVKAKIG